MRDIVLASLTVSILTLFPPILVMTMVNKVMQFHSVSTLILLSSILVVVWAYETFPGYNFTRDVVLGFYGSTIGGEDACALRINCIHHRNEKINDAYINSDRRRGMEVAQEARQISHCRGKRPVIITIQAVKCLTGVRIAEGRRRRVGCGAGTACAIPGRTTAPAISDSMRRRFIGFW